tara:strand:- start:6 stop:482 length:477 start_codon:yes stop_codon:yes gene_type:complete
MLILDRFKLPDKMKRKLLNGISRHGHRDQTKTKIKIGQLLGGKIYHPMFEQDDSWKDIRTWFQNKLEMKVLDWWLISYENGQGCKIHNHEKCDFSAIYYLKVGKDCGDLFFPYEDIRLNPKNNQFIMFDANMKHGVEPSINNNVDRICLAMNIKDEPI